MQHIENMLTDYANKHPLEKSWIEKVQDQIDFEKRLVWTLGMVAGLAFGIFIGLVIAPHV